MIYTLLSFSPLILVTVFAVFAAILIIDDARRHWNEKDNTKNHVKAKI
jgi:hypothetical protein